MGKVIRGLLILVLLAVVALVAYAYLGPMFGADFSAPQSETRIPVELNGE